MARHRDARSGAGPAAQYRYVDSGAGLRSVVGALASEPRFALDTEFHRERTYRPQAALIQVAWPGDLVLIDPLATDVGPLAEVFEAGGLMVAHAAGQDLEVLEHCCGTVPERIFDTQIAAGFLGLGTPALSSLYESEIGWKPPKADRLTDWLVRPLKASQLDYAAGDVKHLLEIHDTLAARLDEMGRRAWAQAEFGLLLERGRRGQKPEDAWSRLKEVRHLRRRDLPVVRSVAMWRELRAARVNQPVRHVLSDVVVVSIAQAAPRTTEELAAVRGVGEGLARGRLGSAHPQGGRRRTRLRLAPAPEAHGALGCRRPPSPRSGPSDLLGEPARARSHDRAFAAGHQGRYRSPDPRRSGRPAGAGMAFGDGGRAAAAARRG